MSIPRYAFTATSVCLPAQDGDWVRWEDVERLKAALTEREWDVANERRRFNEQVADKHRILNEYEAERLRLWREIERLESQVSMPSVR